MNVCSVRYSLPFLLLQPPKFQFYDPSTPFYTSPRFLPPTKIEKCRVGFMHFNMFFFFLVAVSFLNFYVQVKDAIISHGCFLRECGVDRSIVGVRSRIDYGAELKVRSFI